MSETFEPQYQPVEEGQPEEPSGLNQRLMIAFGLVLLAALVAAVVFAVSLMVQNPDQTETIRDIVIIFVAAEALLIGMVLILLVIQVTRLTLLIQTEVTPILESINETLATLRGTSAFLSEKMVRPVIKVNSSVAALRRALDIITFRRSR